MPKKEKPSAEPAEQLPPKSEAEKPTEPTESKAPFKQRLLGFIKTKKGKAVAAILAVVVVLGALTAIPYTRYAIAGMFLKKDLSVMLQDAKTGKPVSDATVSVGAYSAKTDEDGKATIRQVPVGQYTLIAFKKFYKEASVNVTVPILFGKPDAGTVKIEATGRQVPVVVTNKISGKGLAKVLLTAGEATAITDDNGETTLIAPANAATVDATLKLDGYNSQNVTITVTEQKDDKNSFAVVPTGKLYFLSKRTGKINVMKSDLDGSNAKVVVQGTGKEDDYNTQLIASRDWKYLIFKAKHDGDYPKLYLIKTDDDSVSVVDEGAADFGLSGWADHNFVYRVIRKNVPTWQNGSNVIKSFSAEKGTLTQLDALQGNGNAAYPYYGETYNGDPLLLGNEVIFAKYWSGYNSLYNNLTGKKVGIYSMQADGSNRKTVVEKTLFEVSYYEIRPYSASGIHVSDGFKRYEYEDGKLTEKQLSDTDFYRQYPVYLVSPSGNETLWTESRDGKNTLLLGDKNGENEKTLAVLDSTYRQYGWYTDTYVMASKGDSELYIAAKDAADHMLKVTDYHKPAGSISYGGGYGGY